MRGRGPAGVGPGGVAHTLLKTASQGPRAHSRSSLRPHTDCAPSSFSPQAPRPPFSVPLLAALCACAPHILRSAVPWRCVAVVAAALLLVDGFLLRVVVGMAPLRRPRQHLVVLLVHLMCRPQRKAMLLYAKGRTCSRT